MNILKHRFILGIISAAAGFSILFWLPLYLTCPAGSAKFAVYGAGVLLAAMAPFLSGQFDGPETESLLLRRALRFGLVLGSALAYAVGGILALPGAFTLTLLTAAVAVALFAGMEGLHAFLSVLGLGCRRASAVVFALASLMLTGFVIAAPFFDRIEDFGLRLSAVQWVLSINPVMAVSSLWEVDLLRTRYLYETLDYATSYPYRLPDWKAYLLAFLALAAVCETAAWGVRNILTKHREASPADAKQVSQNL
jgi:hypothetical protein